MRPTSTLCATEDLWETGDWHKNGTGSRNTKTRQQTAGGNNGKMLYRRHGTRFRSRCPRRPQPPAWLQCSAGTERRALHGSGWLVAIGPGDAAPRWVARGGGSGQGAWGLHNVSPAQ